MVNFYDLHNTEVRSEGMPSKLPGSRCWNLVFWASKRRSVCRGDLHVFHFIVIGDVSLLH